MNDLKPKAIPNPSRGVNHNSQGSGPVHEIRSSANLTQTEFAAATGLSVSIIRLCEKTGNWPGTVKRQSAVLRFARERGIDYSTII